MTAEHPQPPHSFEIGGRVRVVAGGFMEGLVGTVLVPRPGLPEYIRVELHDVVALFPAQFLWPEA